MVARRRLVILILVPLLAVLPCRAALAQDGGFILIKPARVFDGTSIHEGWAVVVRGERIREVGPLAELRPGGDTKVIEVPGSTLLPGLIEAHSHLFLHPYNETPWDDQVLKESLTVRVARATNHA